MIIFIIIAVFYTFSFIFAFLGLGLFLLINSVFGNNDPKPVYEEFPVYIEPMEVKTSCNTNKDGCKISDSYYCDICDGGIHNRHW